MNDEVLLHGGTTMRHQCAPLIVSGVIFTIVAIVHIFRLIYHWTVIIAGTSIPESVSVIAIVFAGVLAIWMFRAASCTRKNNSSN